MRRHGANKILAAVYRNGPPPSIGALAALLDEDDQQELWERYVADAACSIIKLWAKKSRIPYYSDIVRRRETPYDSRSGRELVDSVRKKWRKKRAAQEVTKNDAV